MYAQVAVSSSRIPKQSTYSYYTDKKLSTGVLVTVPFGHRVSQGIVVSCSEALEGPDQVDPKKVLPILRVPVPYPIVTRQQLALFSWMATYYACPLSSLLALALPHFPKEVLSMFMAGRMHLPRPTTQTLVLAPTYHLLNEIKAKLANRYSHHLIYDGAQSDKERAQNYAYLFHSHSRLVLSTRIGLFLPFDNLGEVYLYNEHDWSYKEQHTPKFHSFDVARKLAALADATLTVIDPTPRFQTWHSLSKPSLTKSSVILKMPKPKIEHDSRVIAMSEDSQNQADDLLSPELTEQLLTNVTDRKNSLLYLNKKNDGGSFACQTCDFRSYLSHQVISCPKCHGTKFSFNSINIRKVAAIINRLLRASDLPEGLWQTSLQGSVIAFYPSTGHQTRKGGTDHHRALITIATQKILYAPGHQHYNLVGMLLADTFLALPEFRTQEKAYAQLFALQQLTMPNGQFLMQTKQPDHSFFRYFLNQDYVGLAKEDLKERQALAYPPFATLLLLSNSAKTPQTVTKHASALVSSFVTINQNQGPTLNQPMNSVEIVGPFHPLHSKTKVRILLKGKNRSGLEPYIKVIPSHWKLDFDPEDIVT